MAEPGSVGGSRGGRSGGGATRGPGSDNSPGRGVRSRSRGSVGSESRARSVADTQRSGSPTLNELANFPGIGVDLGEVASDADVAAHEAAIAGQNNFQSLVGMLASVVPGVGTLANTAVRNYGARPAEEGENEFAALGRQEAATTKAPGGMAVGMAGSALGVPGTFSGLVNTMRNHAEVAKGYNTGPTMGNPGMGGGSAVGQQMAAPSATQALAGQSSMQRPMVSARDFLMQNGNAAALDIMRRLRG